METAGRTAGQDRHCGGAVSPVILLIIGGKMFPSALDIVIDNMHVVGYNYFLKL